MVFSVVMLASCEHHEDNRVTRQNNRDDDCRNVLRIPPGSTRDVTSSRMVEHIIELFEAARAKGVPVFVSPHYHCPTDKQSPFGGTVEKLKHEIYMFGRKGP